MTKANDMRAAIRAHFTNRAFSIPAAVNNVSLWSKYALCSLPVPSFQQLLGVGGPSQHHKHNQSIPAVVLMGLCPHPAVRYMTLFPHPLCNRSLHGATTSGALY